ncbi:MAG: hypothetical protein RLZZ74_3447 [Cyanobacteriota bacterium]|jgi:hypothetical protein
MSDATRIGLYEQKTIIPIQTFSVGTHTLLIGNPGGNSLLSTVYYKDLGTSGTVKVNYFDAGPGDGSQAGERVDLNGHSIFTFADAPTSDRRVITRIANKLSVEVIVTGEDCELGVHVAVVADFPLDPALLDAQTADLEADRGSPVMILGSDGKWYAWRGDNGVPEVSGLLQPAGLSIAGKTSQVMINDANWTALPITPLNKRNALSIQNYSGVEIKLNFDQTTIGYYGLIVLPGVERYYEISDTIPIYAKSKSGSVIITVEEIA